MGSRESSSDIAVLLDLIGSRPIAFQPAYSRVTGSTVAGLMLSQALYWSDRTKDPEGWFWKTREDWEEETGLTRYEQERARKALVSLGIFEEERRGIPAKLHFRVDRERLLTVLAGDYDDLTVDAVLTIYRTTLTNLSRAGYMRAKRMGVEADSVNYADVLMHHGMACAICGEPIRQGPGSRAESLAFDHRVSLSEGGAHVFENIQPSHTRCNAIKGGANKLASHKPTGRSVTSKQDRLPPADIHTETTQESTAENTYTGAWDCTAAFETFWQAFPSGHGSKKTTREVWKRIKPDRETFDEIMAGLERWKASDRWIRGFVKSAHIWLRDEWWRDDPPPPPARRDRDEPIDDEHLRSMSQEEGEAFYFRDIYGAKET